jgi:acetamidase/formamidase
VLTVASGDVVVYPNTWTNWSNEAKYGMSFAEREPIRLKYKSGPYSLIGPVAIDGAQPGDVVEIRMLRQRPIGWGWNSAPKGVGALPHDFGQYLRYIKFDDARSFGEFLPGLRVPLAPFQGVWATQPATDARVSGILSGPYGGNLVLRELVEGTSLFLPVFRAGALVWTGDSHAAQGDGVVDQTAIETAMDELRVQYVLHKHAKLTGPFAETPTHWIGLGFGDSLETALVACLHSVIGWLAPAASIEPVDAYALLSMTASFRITQYADQTGTVYTSVPAKTVHAMIPKDAFSPPLAARVSQSLREA